MLESVYKTQSWRKLEDLYILREYILFISLNLPTHIRQVTEFWYQVYYVEFSVLELEQQYLWLGTGIHKNKVHIGRKDGD